MVKSPQSSYFESSGRKGFYIGEPNGFDNSKYRISLEDKKRNGTNGLIKAVACTALAFSLAFFANKCSAKAYSSEPSIDNKIVKYDKNFPEKERSMHEYHKIYKYEQTLPYHK
ncbi:MAG: hypothetical protein ACQEP1_01105 [Nanobdellota archaeon]